MAKNKGKRSSTGAVSETNKSHDGETKGSSGENFISLDAGALANLTRNIEQKLKNSKDTNKKAQKSTDKAKTGTKAEPKKNFKEKKEVAQRKQETNQGKKRTRDGEVIDKPEKGGKVENDKNQDDLLRKEILALGGSSEDFDLLAEVNSDSEVEDSASGSNKKAGSNEDSLRKELAKLLKDAGQYNPEIPDNEASDEEPSAIEDEEQDDGEEEEDVIETNSIASETGDDNGSSDSEPSKEASKPEVVAEVADKKKNAVTETQSQFPKEYSRLTIMPRSDWYGTELPSIPSSKGNTGLPKFLLDRIQQHATSLLEKENELYSQIQQKSSLTSHKFYSTIMTSGTLSDKISALTLAVQESPLHNIKALGDLVALSRKRSRSQAVDVLRSLKDLLAQGTLLPGDRKLKAFANHGGLVAAFQNAGNKWTERDPLPGGVQPKHLIVWAFEDYLKTQFFEILKVLEIWCNDEIEFSRSRAVSYVYELLKEKPEQEANLLRLLVNKLGDNGKKIASRASYLLLQLSQAHPLMKPTIIRSVEEFLFRPGQSPHAKYYAIITLNQTILSVKEEKVATQLLDIYFAIFIQLLKSTDKKGWKADKSKKGKKGADDAKTQQAQAEHDEQLKEKLISAVLTGVNRAYPFITSDTDRLSKNIDTLFRVTHSSNFNTSIQALMLIQQLTATHQIAADRFYRTLYESLLDPRVATSSKQSLYLNLLYKSLKGDVGIKRVKAFVKRLVQVLGLHQPSFICGVFFLIRELEKTYPGLQSLVDQPEEDESDEEEVFRDVPDEDDQQEERTNKEVEEATKKVTDGYDPRKRDPQHSNADKSCLWELLPLLSHFHPSVSVSTSHVLNHEPLTGKPDLTIHTLSHFLDRFIYRNAKGVGAPRGTSIMQPLAGSDSHDLLVSASGLSGNLRAQEPVNSEAFWRKRTEDIAAEDVFFHEYFNRMSKDKTGKKDKKAKDPVSRDEEAGDESDNEDEIWQALVESRPGLEDDEEDGDDLDMDDLESAYDDDEDEVDGLDDDDEGVIFNDESDAEDAEEEEEEEEEEEIDTAPKKAKSSRKDPKDEDEEEDDFDMDVSDDEAFRDSDEDLPSDLDVDMGGVALPASADQDDDAKDKKKKKRKLRHLPTFASVDDYAALLADEDDGLV